MDLNLGVGLELNRTQVMLLCLVFAIASLGLLYFFINVIEPQPSQISMIENFNTGDYVKVYGQILSVNSNNGYKTFKLCNLGNCVTITNGDGGSNGGMLVKGDYVYVTGTIDSYHASNFIRATDVKLVG